VNQNFTDLINGLSDGTKDLSISALTCAGVVTLNGNTTIGNASGDDLTITASLASSIPIKTHNSYDIGSVTTLGLRAIYFASSSATKTCKLLGAATSADLTVTMPIRSGAILTAPAYVAKTTTYTVTADDDYIACSTAGGAWTLTLPTAVGVAGKTYTFKKTTSDTNALTVDGDSAETINGSATYTLYFINDSVTIYSDGTNWQVRAFQLGGYTEAIATSVSVPTTTQYGDLASISLTPGDWDVTGFAQFDRGTASKTQFTEFRLGISSTSGNSSSGLTTGTNQHYSRNSVEGYDREMASVPVYRISVTSTTTYYLKFYGAYSANQPTALGRLSARRVK
jgi:hypothetical protein